MDITADLVQQTAVSSPTTTQPRPKRIAYRLIDLFAGAGGMTLGFSKTMGSNFVSVWANDFNADACRTYNANFGEHCYEGDILGLLANPNIEIPRADVVIGGPPC